MTESTYPANLDAERSILGAIILDNACFVQTKALSLDDFSLDSHRKIFICMRELHKLRQPIDFVTLSEELSRRNWIHDIAGTAYVCSLTEGPLWLGGMVDGTPRVKNIEHYVRIVRSKAILRGVIALCETAIRSCTAQNESETKILADVNKGFNRLAKQVIP